MEGVNPTLARKLGLTSPSGGDTEPDAQPVTPMRQMRRAVGRAADKAMGLSASVLGIAEETIEAEEVIETGPDGWVVLGLRDDTNAGLTGLFLLDPPLRSALIEMQTMGNLLPPAEHQRKVTRTDAVLSAPFAEQLLKELADVGFCKEELDAAAFDLGPLDDLRTAGLVMMQGLYRVWRVSIQMGGGERQGEMLIAMRLKTTGVAPAKNDASQWSEKLRMAVSDAPAELDTVLTKMTLPISKIQQFGVGQVIKLAGTTVGSVTLVGPTGHAIATARLGQYAGKRAVRLEPKHVELQESPPQQPIPSVIDPTVCPPSEGASTDDNATIESAIAS